MEYKCQTDRTLESVKTAIEKGMTIPENRRKRVFICVAECDGNKVIVHPQNEYGHYDENYKGFQGVEKIYCKNNPNYLDKVAKHLLKVMIGKYF